MTETAVAKAVVMTSWPASITSNRLAESNWQRQPVVAENTKIIMKSGSKKIGNGMAGSLAMWPTGGV